MKKKFGIDQLGFSTSTLSNLLGLTLLFSLILSRVGLQQLTEIEVVALTLIGLSLMISLFLAIQKERKHFISALSLQPFTFGFELVVYTHFCKNQLRKYVA